MASPQQVQVDLTALAREFESPDFDSAKALALLYTHKNERTTMQAICHAMEKLSDKDLLSSLMQLCHLIVISDFPELEELLMARCHGSMHFALRMFFLLQAAMEDEIPELVFKTNRLWKQCELAAINAEAHSPPRNRVCVHNGTFTRKSHKDGASPSPRVARSNSLSASLPIIPLFGATNLDSLSASTSLIPRDPVMSPPKRSPSSPSPSPSSPSSPSSHHPSSPSSLSLPPSSSSNNKQNETKGTFELNPDTLAPNDGIFDINSNSNSNSEDSRSETSDTSSVEGGEFITRDQRHQSVASLMESANVNPHTHTHATHARSSKTYSYSPEKGKRPAHEESESSNDAKDTRDTNNTKDTKEISPPSPSSSSSSSASSSSSHKPTASMIQSAIIQPSYASAGGPPPNTPSLPNQEIVDQPDKALGSAFYFKLRQLSGEGQSGKQRVYEYFYTELHMINSLFNISTALMSISLDGVQKLKEVRGRALRLLLSQINTQLIQSELSRSSSASSASNRKSIEESSYSISALANYEDTTLTYGVEIPVVAGWVIVKLHPEDSFCLSSRNRIPYMMLIEVLTFDDEDPLAISNQPQHQTRKDDPRESSGEDDWVILSDDAPKEGVLKQGFIELWSEKEKRIRSSSPFSHLPGWRLAGVIVKSGDDLRQEQLASQMIFKIHSWFQAEKLPLFLRPYVVLATSSTTGLIECIPDTCSIDSLKKRIPNFGSLSNYFICAYGHRSSHKFLVAQTNFVESLAAYSIVCYLLQIKDRHNGNILLDVEGHMIHIDFGFMLSISPGNLGFEQAPFKLNQEMIDLIGGPNSDMFKYFKTLLMSGLLEVRRHANELLLLVEVMTAYSKMACFQRGGAAVLVGLRERLALDKNEEQVLQLVDTLVYNAMSSWTTQSYDSYQYYTNGIL